MRLETREAGTSSQHVSLSVSSQGHCMWDCCTNLGTSSDGNVPPYLNSSQEKAQTHLGFSEAWLGSLYSLLPSKATTVKESQVRPSLTF